MIKEHVFRRIFPAHGEVSSKFVLLNFKRTTMADKLLIGRIAFRARMGFLGVMIASAILMTGSLSHASMCIVPPEEGNWQNYDAQTRGITRANFRMECRDASTTTCSGGICRKTFAVKAHYFIRLFGSCSPTDCDWGEVEGERLSGSLEGWYRFYFDQGFAKRYVYARTYPTWPGWLRIWIHTDFTDPKRADYTMDDWFR